MPIKIHVGLQSGGGGDDKSHDAAKRRHCLVFGVKACCRCACGTATIHIEAIVTHSLHTMFFCLHKDFISSRID